MRSALVTGSAGFIGSHLAEALLERGWRVRGVDCYLPTYEVGPRRRTARRLAEHPGFELVEEDLLEASPERVLEGIDVVFHLAARPGVRSSWEGFDEYVSANITATRLLLEALVGSETQLVFASSSSVYGNALGFPTPETAELRPISPYGVTKLAAERLVLAYQAERSVDARCLRYFTVYGPRQRSDMAFHRWITAALADEELPLYGDGTATRDFTYVGDAVQATIASLEAPPGTVCNVAGGTVTSIKEAVDLIGAILGTDPRVVYRPPVAGDAHRTSGDTRLLRSLTGWEPRWTLEEGIRAQVEWLRSDLGAA